MSQLSYMNRCYNLTTSFLFFKTKLFIVVLDVGNKKCLTNSVTKKALIKSVTCILYKICKKIKNLTAKKIKQYLTQNSLKETMHDSANIISLNEELQKLWQN